MGCIYSDFNEGKCTLWEEGDTSTFKDSAIGCDTGGICVCEDDPNPWDSCESFEPIDPTEYEEEDENTD